MAKSLSSTRMWAKGLVWNVVIGCLIAPVFGAIHNRIVACRAVHLMQTNGVNSCFEAARARAHKWLRS